MNSSPESVLAAVLFSIAFAVGVRSTWRLWKTARSIAVSVAQSDALIIWSFVIVASGITIAAGWFGFLTVRRMLGFEALEWTPIVSIIVAAAILFIPRLLEYVVDRVGRSAIVQIVEKKES